MPAFMMVSTYGSVPNSLEVTIFSSVETEFLVTSSLNRKRSS